MNHQDRITEAEDVAGDLACFMAESSLPATSSESEESPEVLWQFPEESVLAAAAARKVLLRRRVRIFSSLAATTFAAAIATSWWSGSIPWSRPQGSAASGRDTAIASGVKPIAEEPIDSTIQLASSVDVRASIQPPIADVVPTAGFVGTSGIARSEPPPAQERTASERAASQRSAPAPPVSQRTALMPLRPERSASAKLESAARVELGIAEPAPAFRAPAEPMPAASIIAANPVTTRTVAPEPPPPAWEAPLPAAVRPQPEAFATVAGGTERNEIQRTLGQYRNAYQLLDANAARAVWPSVDVRALARAFDTLTSQQLAFDACSIDVAGESATASCRGSATYTPKVGSREPKLESRQWTFQLRKDGETWKIQRAQTRR